MQEDEYNYKDYQHVKTIFTMSNSFLSVSGLNLINLQSAPFYSAGRRKMLAAKTIIWNFKSGHS